eukprot:2429551-Ditylum_brightwellii.AAC.1
MVVKGVLQSSSGTNMNPLSEQDIDVFEFIEKQYQNSDIRFLGYPSMSGFKKRKNITDEPLPFDSLVLYLMECARKSGCFDIILDDSNNEKQMKEE